MSFLARLLTLVVAIWAVLRILYLLFFARRVAGAAGPRARGRPESAFGQGPREPRSRGRMVRDRVCGTHIPKERALTLNEAGETLYFCGPECRDAHRRGERAGA